MPVKSYLVFPNTGRESQLLKSLSLQNNCVVFPADNNEVFVLVTDTSSDQEDEALVRKLQSEKDLHHINLISGFTTGSYEQGRI